MQLDARITLSPAGNVFVAIGIRKLDLLYVYLSSEVAAESLAGKGT